MEKAPMKTSPVGEAMWAHVRTPREGFTDPKTGKKGADRFELDMAFEPTDPAWAAWARDLAERIKAAGYKNRPFAMETDQDGEKTGRWTAKFRSGEKYPPQVFDKFGADDTGKDYLIGNGSKLRVSYRESEYPGLGGGICLYLNAVQVLELVEYASKPKSAAEYGFETADPADAPFPGDEPAAGSADPFTEAAPMDEEEDELPF